MGQVDQFRTALGILQENILSGIQELDPGIGLREEMWQRTEGGGGRSVAVAGRVFEKGGVNFSDVLGQSLPPSATKLRPQLAGRPFRAMGVSVVLHPRNPYAPASHMNIRFFTTTDDREESTWWFGGGFDLTPFYPFQEDAVLWHQAARTACLQAGDDTLYQKWKAQCDAYFNLPHRNETRGIGGVFFDDFNSPDFAHALHTTLAVGHAYFPAYRTIVARRATMTYGDREREFQLYRRGRYVEFNLLYDRGTLFGLQSKGRTESILMSLPPLVRWEYGFEAEPGSPEAALQDYLRPRDWLSEAS